MAKKKRSHSSEQGKTEDRTDRLELNGVIEETLPGTLFKVKCVNGLIVLATLSGKLRINHIKLLPGDNVVLEVSPYDTSRGRITFRNKS